MFGVHAIQKFMLFTIASFVICLTGCSKYKTAPLTSLEGSKSQKAEVTVVAHELSKRDCKRFFNRKVYRKGYHAVQLSITNSSSNYYALEGHEISLSIENAGKVAQDLRFSATRRVALWGLAGFVLFPFLILAAEDGMKTSNVNRRISRDVEEKALSPHSVINIFPGQTVHKVFFVKRGNFQKRFMHAEK